MRPPAVALTRVLELRLKAGAEHEGGDVVAAAALAEGALHVGHLQHLQPGGLQPVELEPPPAAHYGRGGGPHQVLNEVLGAQADGAAVGGQLHWRGQPQQSDVMVVLGPLVVVQEVEVLLGHRVVTLRGVHRLHVVLTCRLVDKRRQQEKPSLDEHAPPTCSDKEILNGYGVDAVSRRDHPGVPDQGSSAERLRPLAGC